MAFAAKKAAGLVDWFSNSKCIKSLGEHQRREVRAPPALACLMTWSLQAIVQFRAMLELQKGNRLPPKVVNALSSLNELSRKEVACTEPAMLGASPGPKTLTGRGGQRKRNSITASENGDAPSRKMSHSSNVSRSSNRDVENQGTNQWNERQESPYAVGSIHFMSFVDFAGQVLKPRKDDSNQQSVYDNSLGRNILRSKSMREKCLEAIKNSLNANTLPPEESSAGTAERRSRKELNVLQV